MELKAAGTLLEIALIFYEEPGNARRYKRWRRKRGRHRRGKKR